MVWLTHFIDVVLHNFDLVIITGNVSFIIHRLSSRYYKIYDSVFEVLNDSLSHKKDEIIKVIPHPSPGNQTVLPLTLNSESLFYSRIL